MDAPTLLEIALGVGLGALAATTHLALLEVRVRWLVKGRRLLAFLTQPAGIVVATGILFAAFHLSRPAGLAALATMVVVERVALARKRQEMES